MSAGVALPGRSWRALVGPAVATLVALAILVGLGVWQLERKTWKENLLAQIAARAYGIPGDIVQETDWPGWSAAADEFRRVGLSGTYLTGQTVAVHGLAEERRGQALQGYYLFTPLRLASGGTVIVNRGFVPTEFLQATLAAVKQAPSVARLVGLVRSPETRGAFVPENDPGRGQWFVRSLADMARAGHLDRVAPFYVDADATPNPGGWPRGGQTQMTLPNNHLQYAFTWFGLAVALLCVFGVFASRRLSSSAPHRAVVGARSSSA